MYQNKKSATQAPGLTVICSARQEGQAYMSRSLKVSRRPFIAFAIVLSPLVVIFAAVLIQKGFRPDLILPALLPFILYAAIMTAICSQRVSVDDAGIAITRFFVFRQIIPFSEIQRSEIQILAERDHPMSLAIYTAARGAPAATIGLKPFRKEDVAWLCALPELKPETCLGFTRKA